MQEVLFMCLASLVPQHVCAIPACCVLVLYHSHCCSVFHYVCTLSLPRPLHCWQTRESVSACRIRPLCPHGGTAGCNWTPPSLPGWLHHGLPPAVNERANCSALGISAFSFWSLWWLCNEYLSIFKCYLIMMILHSLKGNKEGNLPQLFSLQIFNVQDNICTNWRSQVLKKHVKRQTELSVQITRALDLSNSYHLPKHVLGSKVVIY